jgi:hypothetical protein
MEKPAAVLSHAILLVETAACGPRLRLAQEKTVSWENALE